MPARYQKLGMSSVSSDIFWNELKSPTSPKALLLINALIMQAKFQKDPKASALLRKIPPELKPMAFAMMAEASIEKDARKDVDIPRPGALHPSIENPSLGWKQESEQVVPEQLSETARTLTRLLQQHTVNYTRSNKRFEYAGIIIELADGAGIRPGFEVSSYKETQMAISDILKDSENAFLKAEEKAGQKKNIREGKVKFILLHTHPQNMNELAGVRMHEDGRYFTHLSDEDCLAVDMGFNRIVDKLRHAGFTGPIELTIGAIPVPLRPIEDLDERSYVATYTREIPALKATFA